MIYEASYLQYGHLSITSDSQDYVQGSLHFSYCRQQRAGWWGPGAMIVSLLFYPNFLLVLVNTGCCESLEYRLHAALHHLPTASPLPPPPRPASSCRHTVQGVCEVTGRSRRALCHLGMDQRDDQVRGTVVMETISHTTTHSYNNKERMGGV